MKRFLAGIILCAIGLVHADVESALKEANIDKDIKITAPNEKIEVKYGDKAVELGNEFAPTITKDVPEVHYKHEGGVLYTLALTDPDIPMKGYYREWKHWLVGNIPEDKVGKGEVLAEYVGPAPPNGTGTHRYIFLLYKQNQGAITFTERRLSARDKARKFSITKFAQSYNLEGPIAANFFTAKYDDYVPIIHKQISL
ncbi:protein D2-like [Venturia canescens]|uniref:protein D2-like n=1 Tax=Venturia canescens TaxID=32260 RepID=UPI001C9D2C73|nr:protein D2-like [Venturia canescens]